MDDDARERKGPETGAMGALEREIIDDIRAACRRFGWATDVRPSFEAYLDQRGHFYEKDIKRLGGWKRLCALGGMHACAAIVPPPGAGDDSQSTAAFDAIVADARQVAAALRLKAGARLTYAAYRRGGGLYGLKIVQSVGGWTKVSTAAGFPSAIGGTPPSGRRQWQKTEATTMTAAELDAALDSVAVRACPSRSILWKKALKAGRDKRRGQRSEETQAAGAVSSGGELSAVGWGLWEAARAMGVSVKTLKEAYRRVRPASTSPEPDANRPGVYRVRLGSRTEAGEPLEALVDEAAVPLIKGGVFYLVRTGSKGGAQRPGSIYVSMRLPGARGSNTTPLRRIVMGLRETDDRVKVSHANGDPLDCRRENLIVQSIVQNSRNAAKQQQALRGRAGSSRFKGVCWIKKEGKWRAKIQKDRKPLHLGQFVDEVAAARAYDEAARELFGEHAYQNFPDGTDAEVATTDSDDSRTAA